MSTPILTIAVHSDSDDAIVSWSTNYDPSPTQQATIRNYMQRAGVQNVVFVLELTPENTGLMPGELLAMHHMYNTGKRAIWTLLGLALKVALAQRS